MTELATKLAEALPPLPESVHLYHDAVAGLSEYLYTADQMRDYARAALAATQAPALYVGLIERLMQLSTRLGIANEGGVEHFAAGLEDRLYAICRSAESLLDSLAATPAPAEQVALRDFAERVGIRMDCWDMGAASMAYSDGCHGVTRVHLERLAQMVGVSFWNAARKLEREALAATPAPAPLTDEQIDKTAKRVIPVAAYMGMFEYAAFSKEDADRTVRHFARAIERAHGIGKGKESA